MLTRKKGEGLSYGGNFLQGQRPVGVDVLIDPCRACGLVPAGRSEIDLYRVRWNFVGVDALIDPCREAAWYRRTAMIAAPTDTHGGFFVGAVVDPRPRVDRRSTPTIGGRVVGGGDFWYNGSNDF